MRIAILTGGDGWHIRDLCRAGAELGHEMHSIDFRRLAAGTGVAEPPLHGFDAAIVRTMPPGSLEQVVFRMDLLHTALANQVRVMNSPRAVEACVDKYLATSRLAQAGLPVPPTFACADAETALDAFEMLGRNVLLKPLFGSEGRGIIRISDPELAWRTFRAIERIQGILYVQQFILNPGWDLRVFVLSGRVLGAMRRHSRDGWRANITQGGRGECVSIGEEESELAIRAAIALGAEAAGVDLLLGNDGQWYILEVNGVPGWQAFSAVTGVDVACHLVEAVAR